MIFASVVFLFLFLPLVLASYYALPRRFGNGVLLIASVGFYAWGEGWGVALVAASVLVNWAFGMLIGSAQSPGRRNALVAAAVTANLAALAAFKYSAFLFDIVAGLWPALQAARFPQLALPLGISFFTFHAISYVVDVRAGRAPHARNLGTFALYIALFPQLIAGPIIRWRDIAAQLGARETRLEDVAAGIRRFVWGLAKKVLVANPLGLVADQVFALPPGELGASVAWLGLICYALQIYFDFSGYSDMAIGLMRMFGFRILENFNYPYIARSVREFWQRWHISLSNWFRDYVYVPLGGNQRGALRTYFNLIVVFLLCGLWHGASWTFVAWGAWHGAFMIAERAGLERILERLGPARHVYALLAILGGWVLFRCDTLTHASAYYAALCGAGAAGPGVAQASGYLDSYVIALLGAGVIGSTPWMPRAAANLRQLGTGAQAGGVLLTLALFAASVSWLAAGSYNPFIYFRF